MDKLYENILSEVKKLPIIDTHEHLDMEEHRVKKGVDLFSLFMTHYASSDLISAGMPVEDMDKLRGNQLDIDEKWRIFKPYWERAKNTSYCQCLLIAVKDIYGIDDINDFTYQELNARIVSMNKPGLYRRILKDMSHIELSICDVYWPDPFLLDEEFYRPAARFDEFIFVESSDDISALEKRHGRYINSLNQWVRLLEDTMKKYKEKYHICAVKSGLAYSRILRYERTDYSEAEAIFNQLLSARGVGSEFCIQTKPLQDYMMHKVVQIASEMDLPIQIHTGLQEGNGNVITNSNPSHLINLFMDYPQARFDIFHAGYPYGGELSAIVKNFPNVYADMCWTHIISREYAVRILEEWLDTIPANKIFGFGGDYIFVEGVYGHQVIARENIARALANKVEKGYIKEGQCLDIAQRLLYQNPKEFFKL